MARIKARKKKTFTADNVRKNLNDEWEEENVKRKYGNCSKKEGMNATRNRKERLNCQTSGAQLCLEFRPVLKAAPNILPLPNVIMQCRPQRPYSGDRGVANTPASAISKYTGTQRPGGQLCQNTQPPQPL